MIKYYILDKGMFNSQVYLQGEIETAVNKLTDYYKEHPELAKQMPLQSFLDDILNVSEVLNLDDDAIKECKTVKELIDEVKKYERFSQYDYDFNFPCVLIEEECLNIKINYGNYLKIKFKILNLKEIVDLMEDRIDIYPEYIEIKVLDVGLL